MSTHHRRGLAVIAAAVAAAVTVLPAAATADAGDRTAKPTVILEHGAFADGSSWNQVVAGLRRDGYPVVAAANPLRGVASDAAALRGLIDHVDGPVILVGHSYGGSVISAAGAGNSKVKALVYVAAFLPEAGESALGLSTKFPGSTLPGALETVTGPDGPELYIRQDAFHRQFAADVPAREAALMAATQRPVAQAALEEQATAPAWREKPSWDVITTKDLNIPVAAQRFMAKRAKAHVTEAAASHAVTVSHPGVVVDVIETADRATRTRTR
ncbi:alpha/beta hydrolase [Nonomuraea sp. NPDC050310]|uniref:alpha/beta fold hydrolase n=1 Tax=Nonomuraea sp. NPDC050310 TaxID=3154935 RepID=UPI0033F79CCC